jgi:glycosyltransferase involved in cell wall biosynthesis
MGKRIEVCLQMKILLVSSSSGSRGGGEIYLLYLARALVRRGHEVTLWASSHPRMDELAALFTEVGTVVRSEYTNTYDHRTRSLASFLNFSGAARIADEWKALRPDVIHVNKQNLEDGLDLLRAATLSKCASICTIHLSQTAAYLKASLAWLRDWIAHRALDAYNGAMVCVLDERANDLRNFLGRNERIHAVANGVELYDLAKKPAVRESKRAELGIAPNELLIAAVGRLVPQKRPFIFLDLAERIHSRVPHVRFVWIGDGSLSKEWDERAARLGYVRRVGWQRSVSEFLFAADVFLHTAEFEGLPLAILEALSSGLPCAITPNLLAEMPFLDGTNSISISEDEVWADVLSDPSRLDELGKNARQLAEKCFSFDTMAARYEALYEEARK